MQYPWIWSRMISPIVHCQLDWNLHPPESTPSRTKKIPRTHENHSRKIKGTSETKRQYSTVPACPTYVLTYTTLERNAKSSSSLAYRYCVSRLYRVNLVLCRGTENSPPTQAHLNRSSNVSLQGCVRIPTVISNLTVARGSSGRSAGTQELVTLERACGFELAARWRNQRHARAH